MLRPFSWTVVFFVFFCFFPSTSMFICFLITTICTAKALMALGECWDEMIWVIIPFWTALWTLCNPGKEEKFYDSLYCRGEKSYACINRTNVSPRSLKWLTQDHSKSQRSPDLLHSLNYMPFFFWSHGLPVTTRDISLGQQLCKGSSTTSNSGFHGRIQRSFCYFSMFYFGRVSSSGQEQQQAQVTRSLILQATCKL